MIAHTRTHAPTRALTPPPLTHMYKFVHCIGASAYAYMACMRSWIWHSNRQGIHFFIDTSHTSIFLNSLMLWLCIHRSSYMYFTHTCMHVFIHGIHTWHAWMNTHDMHVCKYKFIFIWHSSMAHPHATYIPMYRAGHALLLRNRTGGLCSDHTLACTSAPQLASVRADVDLHIFIHWCIAYIHFFYNCMGMWMIISNT